MNIPLIRKFSRMLLLCLAVFVITSVCIHAILGKVIDPLDLYAVERSEKLSSLQADKNNYSVAAFGSSRVHTSFDPRVFDRNFKNAVSQKSESYNLAIIGGSQTEQRGMAERYVTYLKERKIEKALVILELGAGLNLQDAHLIHPRAINLYDADTVAFSAGFTGLHRGYKRVAGRSGYAIAAGTLNQLNVGMLAAALFKPQLDSQILEAEYSDDRRGFLPKGTTKLRAVVEKLFAERAEVRSETKGALQPGHRKLIDELKGLAGDQVALKFVYIVVPTLSKNLKQVENHPESIATSAGEVPIINFEKDVDLFQGTELWSDPGHLSEKGGALLTEHLAKRLVELNLSHEP